MESIVFDQGASASAESDGAAQSNSGGTAPVVRKKVAFNVSVLAGSQGITWSLTLVWMLVVPRLLGPSGMGEIVTATSVASILGVVLGLGTRTFLVREIVVAPDRAPGLIGSSIVLRTCLVPVFAAAVIVYSHLAHFGNDESWVLYLATAATVLMLLTEPIQAAFQAFERMEYLAYSNVVSTTLQVVLGVTLALIGFRARGLTACMVFVVAVVLALNAWWARSHVRINLRTNVHQMRSLVKDSLAYWSFGPLLHDLPMDRHRDPVAHDRPEGRRVVRRLDEAFHDAHVLARHRVDGMATPPGRRLRRGAPPTARDGAAAD